MENSRFKFRAWDKDNFEFLDLDNSDVQIELTKDGLIAKVFNCGEGWTPDEGYFEKPSWDIANAEFMQFTGLVDKQGVEIYEFMEIDNLFEVSFYDGCYILTNISNKDIIPLNFYLKEKNGQVEVTKEYAKI